MKNYFLSLLLLVIANIVIFAQSPQSFKYQAVVRDVAGLVIENQNVGLKISILEGSVSGPAVYEEEHAATSNDFGLINLDIGTGTVLSGDFTSINWGNNSYFVQIELDETGGTTYLLMGTSQLMSVPYSLYANEAGNVIFSDTSSINELQLLSISSDTLFLSNGNYIILTDNVDDADSDPTNEIQVLSLSNDTLYMSGGNSIYLNTLSDTSYWEKNANDIYYDIGNVGVGTISPNGKLQVSSDTTAGINEVIFSVLNAMGDTVFAVYQEGVRIWVSDDTTSAKASGSRGGFAVGGFNPAKSFTNEYLRVTPDSVRVYIREGSGSKASGSRGGFAVGGFNPAKAFTNEFLRVTDDSSRVWTYGDGGFGILDLETGSVNYLDLTPNNYFIGHESGDQITSGLYNSTIGYQSGYYLADGNNNSFMGYQSGWATVSGNGNLFLGNQSGFSNTVGHYNTFVGYKSGFNNTTGRNNSFLGTASGYSNAVGDFNTFVGDSTGYSNVDGSNNSFLGDRAGFNNITGSNNVFLGKLSGFSNSGDSCIFIGNSVGYSNTGVANVFIGNRAGFSNTSGFNNVFNGYRAGYSNSTGQNNIFMGTNSGFSNTSGNYNVFLGTGAGSKNTTGWYNMFLGYYAGYENTTANNNIFMGYFTGFDNSTGSDNIFIGNHNGQNNISGTSNIFIGGSTGYYNTGGGSNVFIGTFSGNHNTTGNWNTFIGRQTGYDNTTGNFNSFIGYEAGGNNTIGASNTIIGSYAGEWLQTGLFNTAVGYQAGNRIYGGSYSVYLGYRAGYYEEESNRLFIENSWADSTGALIYGRFDDNWLRINNGLGIGRNPEVNNLEVEGTASKTTAGDWLANSDKRIKTDISEIENSYEQILKLRPVTFRYSEEWMNKHPNIEDKVYYNFIAQEYQQVFPKSVKGSGEYLKGDDKEILQIDTYNAQIITIQAVRDLIKENQELKNKLKNIQKENKQIIEANSEMLNRLEKVEALLNSTVKK